ncbi:uncharacterized protein [Rutidosis leptorrhynchoides]|uniref:uncharacterized protein n=1 Tax=Rutidosis leptorrhynchoides TaxID=125765 RepID=UPI003A9A16AD
MAEHGFSWNWRRMPSGRAAGELEFLCNILSSCSINHRSVDKWKWSKTSNGIFKVSVLASEIDEHILTSNPSTQCTLRNNLVPKKVEIFVWRALRKRLPVRIELDKRGLDLNSVRCPLCDDGMETVEHTFIFCKQTLDIWDRVFKWWNIGPFSSFSLQEIFEGKGPTTSSSLGLKIWQAVEWTCAYLIWENRNHMAFQGKGWKVLWRLTRFNSNRSSG